MQSDLRKFYGYHFFCSIGTAVAASFLFLDRLFLRVGLDMAQIGIIKGISFWLPMAINLAVSPMLLRLQIDQKVVAIGFLIRVTVPFGFLFLHHWTTDTNWLTAGYTVLSTVAITCAVLANNSAQSMFISHIPRDQLGKHTSRMIAVWNIPFLLLAIPCGWYIDRQAVDNESFFRAYLYVLAATAVFQIPASWFIWRVSRTEQYGRSDLPVRITEIIEPFRDVAFQGLLMTILGVSTISAMVIAFIYPFLTQAHQMPIAQISALEAATGCLGFLLMPVWGAWTDRFGGKNILRACALGVAVSLFLLVGAGLTMVFASALLAFKTTQGLIGSGLATSQQYLTLSLSRPEQRNIYLAAATFVSGCGMLLGAVFGGVLLEWLKARTDPAQPYEHYRIYFLFCAMAFLLTGSFISALREDRRSINPIDLAVEVFRQIRSFGGKNR